MATELTIAIPELKAIEERWASIPTRLKAEIRSTLMRAAIEVQAIAKEEAPVKTGRLRGAIMIIPLSETKVAIRANTNYAEYVEKGTGVYGPNRSPIVRPNGGNMFTQVNPGFGSPNSRGYWFLGKSVKGQKSNPFMQRAKHRSMPILRRQFGTMLETVVEGLK